MNRKTLLIVFVASLGAAAIISAVVHAVPLQKHGAEGMELWAMGLFVAIVEILRGVFVSSNTYVRTLSKTWGWVMIGLSLLVTAGFSVAWYTMYDEPFKEPFFWIGQVYNVLVLSAEWSVSVVVGGFKILWQDLIDDMLNINSLKYNMHLSSTEGKIDWDSMPDILQPLKDVVRAIHKHISTLDNDCSTKVDTATSEAQRKLKEKDDTISEYLAKLVQYEAAQKRSEGLLHIAHIASNKWIPTGESNGGYMILCADPETGRACPPFRASKNVKTCNCPSCGKNHSRDVAAVSVQLQLSPKGNTPE